MVLLILLDPVLQTFFPEELDEKQGVLNLLLLEGLVQSLLKRAVLILHEGLFSRKSVMSG